MFIEKSSFSSDLLVERPCIGHVLAPTYLFRGHVLAPTYLFRGHVLAQTYLFRGHLLAPTYLQNRLIGLK